nr:hypothetical protein [Wolbachia endosymbiont of Bemisia tabaci]
MPAAHFSLISPAFEETVVEHTFDTRLELSSDKENQSCSQTVIPFPGFAEFDNQFCNTVTENSTVSSSLTSNEHISDSLEGEQLSPEYYNYLINGVTSLQSSKHIYSKVLIMKEAKKSPVVRLKATAKEFNFSKLRADQDNKLANSGETMFLDFQRMNFIINEKEIDKNFIIAFKEGAKDYKNEIFNRDNFDNLSEEGKAFMEPVLRELDQDRLSEVWENHCNSPTVADEKKIDEYRKEFERFYNAGRSSYHLFSKKDYRALAKEIFKEMFRYAEAKVPSDAILEELVTNCNQEAVVLKVNRKIDVAVNKYLKFVWAYLFTAMLLLYRNSFRAILLSKQSTVSY